MKKAKRLIAILMAAIMLVSAAFLPAYAKSAANLYAVPKIASNKKYYFSPQQGAGWLLDMLDDLYYKKAAKLKYSIDNFISDVYDAYERLDENGNFDASDVISTQEEADEYIRQLNEGAAIDPANNDALVIAVYDYLWGYEYGDYTVAELFEDVYDTEDLRLLYPLVESTTGLSEGQISAMQLCGIANMTICTIN